MTIVDLFDAIQRAGSGARPGALNHRVCSVSWRTGRRRCCWHVGRVAAREIASCWHCGVVIGIQWGERVGRGERKGYVL